MSEKADLLRHFLASIAYHATKAIKDAPDDYPELDVGKGVRTPRSILHHITGILSYAHSFYEHYETTYFEHRSWDGEVRHFYETLSKLDRSFQEKGPDRVSEEQLL
jgi:hypothetical protein